MESEFDGKSLDIVSENVSKLKEIFPEVITENKIDFEKLKLILGEDIDTGTERYSFTWPGKSQAVREAQKISTGTLRPCKEESKDWDTTKNLYIEGDNLEVLKSLQKSYFNKIKAIYIDPPYNTGNDFVYNDDYKDNLTNYLEKQKFTTNKESDGRFHSKWLNMMYPRLKLARNLLKDDGFIFISISDEEVNNLRKICDEIFGEDNFRNTISTRRYDKNLNIQFAKDGLKSMNVGLEYVLIYSKNPNSKLTAVYRESNDERSKKGYWKGFWNNADRPTMRYPILGFEPLEGQWKWKKEIAYEAINNYIEYQENFAQQYSLEEYWFKTGKTKRFIRRKEGGTGKNKGVEHWVAPSEGILRNSNWSDILVSKKNNVNIPFDSPKNPYLLKELILLSGVKENEIILDFFSGSSSTAVALLEYNLENDTSNNFIMIQIPEETNEKSDAYKQGYNNICEIGKERIRREGDNFKKNNEDLDIGFKVFKLDSSNLNKWNPDYENLEQSVLIAEENIKSDRSHEDIIYELILGYGIDLTIPIEKYETSTNTIYSIGFGALIICLDDKITTEVCDSIIELSKDSEITRVVFKDNGFVSDSDKTNIKEILRINKIDEFITI